MKRISALILAAVLAFALCACGAPALPALPGQETASAPSPEPETRGDVTLDLLLCGGDTEARARFFGPEFVARFEAANPGLKLTLDTVSEEDAQRVVEARIADGRAPDILITDGFPDYLPGEFFLSAEEYCPAALLREFYPSLLRLTTGLDGVLRALPVSASARVLFCNAGLLAEAGVEVPATWDELEEACGRILEHFEGAVVPWGLALGPGESACVFADYAWGNGGGFVGADGSWALNSPENAEAIAFIVSLIDKGFAGPNPARDTAAELQARFAEGSLAMLIASDALADTLREGDGAVDAAIAPIPSSGGGRAASVEVGSVLTVLRSGSEDDSARREAVGRFLLFFYEGGSHAAWAASEGALPVLRSAAEDPAFAEWGDVLENGRYYPDDLPEWDAVCAGLAAVEQQALIGGDAAAALDALQDEITR